MKDYNHIQTAHCENGVVVGLLNKEGLEFLTEPLAFGIGSGLFYIHVPFLKVNNAPAISFRSMPGSIFNRTCKSLGIKVVRKKFSSTVKAQKYLDDQIDQGNAVGCQVGVYNLPYFPVEYRFHFNAHNIIVFGKEGDNYLVSDPVMESTTQLTKEELEKVRFSKGPLAPKGQIYYPTEIGEISQETIRKGIITGINRNVRDMIKVPSTVMGVRGMRYTAGKIKKWRAKHGERKAGLFLGQIVRMQEEIGTGGGGFRFLYAAFLEQASEILGNDKITAASELITKSGDMWRSSALQMAGIYKGRITAQKDFERSAEIIEEIAEVEKEAFKILSKIKF